MAKTGKNIDSTYDAEAAKLKAAQAAIAAKKGKVAVDPKAARDAAAKSRRDAIVKKTDAIVSKVAPTGFQRLLDVLKNK